MKADSTMGASSGNTRGGPVFCFVSSFLQLHPICQSVSHHQSQASKQAISAHTILYVQYTQERTHARTYAPIVLTLYPTVPHSTTRFFSPIISICALLFPPFLSFHFFSFLSFCLLTPFIYTMIASLNFSVLFLLSPICSLAFVHFISSFFEFVLSPSSHSLSSLTLLFSLASPPLLKCGMIANNLEI